MFGGHDRVHVVDGYVESDGAFWVVLEVYGVRHLLIVGKGKKPLKVIGVDVTIGQNIKLGVVDLSGQCPKQ